MKFRNVLLLDSAMAPVKTISWQRAMILWFQKKAAILEHQDIELRGETWSYKIPSVVQLKGYVMKQRDKHIRFSRRNIFFRDDNTCQYCHKKFQPQKLTLEHVLPRCRGGATSWQNIVSACFPCNQRKEGMTPDEAGMKLKREPVRPQGNEFFRFAMPDEVPEAWKPYIDWIKKR